MPKRYANQRAYILDYMRMNGSINPMQALAEIGCYRLAARICELREQGYRINTLREPNHNNEGTHARYVLLPGVNK